MAKSQSPQVDRRGFLKGAAAGAAAIVAAPSVAAEPAQSAPTRSGAPLPSAAQLAADTGEPPAISSRIIERPGSDFMVDVFKTLGFEYVAANPGSSFEGLHESVINYGNNQMPELLTCCH